MFCCLLLIATSSADASVNGDKVADEILSLNVLSVTYLLCKVHIFSEGHKILRNFVAFSEYVYELYMVPLFFDLTFFEARA